MAPPSPNTSWLILHRGFDTLTLAIKATLPKPVFEHLMEAKQLAGEERREVLTEWNGVEFLIRSYGGSGYELIASGGPYGANWSFKKPNVKDPWGVRVTIGSEFLAVFGLGTARAHIEDVTARLGLRYRAEDVSISRVDYCVDVLAPGFQLDPDHFVLPAKMKRVDHSDLVTVGASGKVKSVTVGHVANKQAIIYDKRGEVIARNKSHWWEIWRESLKALEAQGNVSPGFEFDPKDPQTSRVWRVEMRAGKRLLKDRWGITTWADLFERGGDMFRSIGETIRYCEPSPDSNRARWPNHLIWELACGELNDDLSEMRSGVDPLTMKRVHRESHINLINRNIIGCCITHAALHGIEFDDVPAHFAKLADDMSQHVKAQPEKSARSLEAAKGRYCFLS